MRQKTSLQQSIAMLIVVTIITTGVTSYAAYTREKEVTVIRDGVTEYLSTKAPTVEAVLEEIGYRHTDRTAVNLPLDAEISDYMEISIHTEKTVTLSLYDARINLNTDADTVGELLKEQGIEIGESDILNPSAETAIHDGLTITIDKLVQSVREETEILPYETIEEFTEDLYEGETRVVQEGLDGSMRVITRKSSFNGSVLPDSVTEIIDIEPQNEIIEIGTAVFEEPEVSTEADYRSSYSSGGEWMLFTATAYDPSVGDTTRMGTPARVGIIAVDPDVIPLGSIVEVEGYGVFSAEDTGGAIIGKKIDIFVSTYEEAINFGIRTVRVRVLQ